MESLRGKPIRIGLKIRMLCGANGYPYLMSICSGKDPGSELEHQPLLSLLLPDTFRGIGAWWKTMEHHNRGNFPGSGPEVVESGAKGP